MSSSHPDLLVQPHAWPRTAPAPAQPRLRTRLRVVLTRGHLDASLADGVDAGANAELALRASQLTAARYRRSLAGRLEQIVRVAERPPPRLSAAPPPARASVIVSKAALHELAGALRERPEVSTRGVALAQRLLTDGAGPLYVAADPDVLWHAVRRAGAALQSGPQSTSR